MYRAVICSFVLVATAFLNVGNAQVTFTEVTVSAGVDYVQHNYVMAPNANRQIYFSGGAAAADYDGDGWTDLFVTRLDDVDILFRNNGDGTFSDVTSTAFSAELTVGINSNGAAWADVDNDDDLDLYITCIDATRYQLFLNDGNGFFTEHAVSRGVSLQGTDAHFGFSTSFGDYDLDGYLDLHTTEWRNDFQAPGGLPFNVRLFNNLGAANPGHFVDVTDAAGVAYENVPVTNPNAFDGQSFSTHFTDLDQDGWPDLIVASDHNTSRLFWNNQDGTFTDGTVAANVGTDRFGMGSHVGDYDNDGDLDWYVTSIFDDLPDVPNRDGNRLFRNDGGRNFTDVTDAANVRNGEWGWGVAWADIDNDGDLDIVQTNGLDWPAPFFSEYHHGDFIDDPSKLWINDGNGQFTQSAESIGFTDTRSGKALVTFDYDNDGDLDVFVVNCGEHPVLYRNDGGNDNNWLKIKTVGTESNRDGIGAFITLTADSNSPSEIQVREVDGGASMMGQNDRMVHFGVGTDTILDELKVVWPSGIEQTFFDVDTNQTLTITEALLGDVNLDGVVNLLDVSPFVSHLQNSTFQAEADLNGDGQVNLLDVSLFVNVLSP